MCCNVPYGYKHSYFNRLIYHRFLKILIEPAKTSLNLASWGTAEALKKIPMYKALPVAYVPRSHPNGIIFWNTRSWIA